MEVGIIGIIEVRQIAADLTDAYADFWPGLLFGGDRVFYCDEGVVAKIDGQPVGLASIAPKEESGQGPPEVVAVYVAPPQRRKGVGLTLLCRAAERLQERKLVPFSVTGVTVEGKGLVAKYFKGENQCCATGSLKEKL